MIALSHTSALRYLRSQSEIKRLSPSKTPSAFGISRYDAPRLAQRFDAVGDGTVHVLVTEQRRRRSISSVTCHLAEKIPPNGFTHIEGDIFCSSPELCFLQMARVLPLLQLIKLGFELCGCYALAPDGRAIEQPALTSKDRIDDFLRSAKGARRCSSPPGAGAYRGGVGLPEGNRVGHAALLTAAPGRLRLFETADELPCLRPGSAKGAWRAAVLLRPILAELEPCSRIRQQSPP